MNTDIHRFFYFLSLSVCEARVHSCPILSFHVEAQPKSRFGGIQCWSEAEVPLSTIGNNSLLSAKTYQLSANSLSAGLDVHLFLQDSLLWPFP
jgi:hypothetical protein